MGFNRLGNKTNCGEVVLAEQDEAEDVVSQI